MTTICFFFLSLIVAFDKSSSDDVIQGFWEVTELKIGGKQFPIDQSPNKTRYIFAGNKLIRTTADDIEDILAFRLESSQNPKQIELKSSDGTVLKGIYRMQNQKLTFFLGESRPRSFESEVESSLFVVLKRLPVPEKK